MKQTKVMSLVEVLTNTAIGFCIAFVANAAFMKLVGVEASAAQNFALTVLMTVVSIVRSYTVRRVFNGAWKRPQAEQRFSGWTDAEMVALRNKFDEESA